MITNNYCVSYYRAGRLQCTPPLSIRTACELAGELRKKSESVKIWDASVVYAANGCCFA